VKNRFLVLWAAAVLATAAAFVAHLSLRLETVRLGYDVGLARREQQRLVEQRRLLSIEAATLREPSRVEAVARGSLAMEVPDPSRVVSVGQRGSRRPAGRMR
jgi:cell division protein FtsL